MSELTDFLARGRTWHRQVMTDTCTVTRPGGRTYDEDTQQYTDIPTIVYAGPGRLRVWRGTDEQAAEAEVNVQRYYLDLPLTGAVPDVARRDIVTLTASLNPVLVGRVLVLTDVETETTDTALRSTCEFVQ